MILIAKHFFVARATIVEFTYDAWGNILTQYGSLADINPFRYRGYYYDNESWFYYLQSRYYDPSIGRFINADAFASTSQGLLGNNMFAYCNNNPIYFVDPFGYRPTNKVEFICLEDDGYGPNTKFLMAFYGVDSPKDIPEMPEGAMIFVENVTSVSLFMGIGIVEGRTIVMDANKYCEYMFVGIGWSESRSIPLDRSITQGFVYGIRNVEDYCGLFMGASSNMLATSFGGAYASPEVYAEIMGGMSYAPSVGASVTWYLTGQSGWIYGPANMVVVTNPNQFSPLYQQQNPNV